MYDFLLVIHVLAAFALFASITIYTVLTIVGWRIDRPGTMVALSPLVKLALPMVILATLTLLVFGVWLAIYLDAYQLWDGWILASLALFVVSTATGIMSERDYNKARELSARLVADGNDEPNAELRALNQSRHGLVLQLVADAATLGVLILMIYKPGA